MRTKYQIIILGNENIFIENILDVFFQHIEELNIKKESIIIIDRNNFQEYKANAPAVCLYFGRKGNLLNDIDITTQLKQEANIILPIVYDLEDFNCSIPELLREINGVSLSSKNDIEPLVNSILEGFGLLRISRKLFISYRRNESSEVAIQLYEQLEKHGFDVFLDTHSIRPGEPFQEELWHRMADTDVIVLLNTPGFLDRKWTKEEVAQANAMSIGILQVVWPKHRLENIAKLGIPFQLSDSSFGNPHFKSADRYLSDDTIEDLISSVESFRARCLASRQDNIVTNFILSAKRANKVATLQPERYITIEGDNNKEFIFIPTVGVPEAFIYNRSDELVCKLKSKDVKGYLIYDHLNIREHWLTHLSWLDNHLPIKSIKILDAEKWLQKNV